MYNTLKTPLTPKNYVTDCAALRYATAVEINDIVSMATFLGIIRILFLYVIAFLTKYIEPKDFYETLKCRLHLTESVFRERPKYIYVWNAKH
jgi:hypothetical protein